MNSSCSPTDSPKDLAKKMVDSLYSDESPLISSQSKKSQIPHIEDEIPSNYRHHPRPFNKSRSPNNSFSLHPRSSYLEPDVYQDIWANTSCRNNSSGSGVDFCNFTNNDNWMIYNSQPGVDSQLPVHIPPPQFLSNENNTSDTSRLDTIVHRSRQFSNDHLNYRKLLEKHVSCDWNVIVERIVRNNDQQASIFLQQKLKTASPQQKDGIINAAINRSFDLMINRFGNFLIQRCFEYGTASQVVDLATDMQNKVCQLSTDPFGCHVIQKAIDCVNLEIKAMIIEEMLACVKETVIHRYACHVWQKLFELQNESTPPDFMTRLNQRLKGFWVVIAQGETGSLVVQNIFENCCEKDKLPCVLEVVANLDTIIRGQWGNWVIQHMVEHAAEPYRQIVIDKVIEMSPIYSIDQFASKAVEKMLKMGNSVIIQAFLDKVTVWSPNRTRIPLVDIASDANGNFLVQYILQSGTTAQKEIVIAQLKRHMVSLRGSKWGSKCALLIDKHRNKK